MEPNGDLLTKETTHTTVQDQIFSAVQDIAKTKRYDFIFDKSSDVVMLYSANKYDISDQVVKLSREVLKENRLIPNLKKKN